MTFAEIIAKRSSTRGYKKTALTEEELKQIVEAGLQAPTAANRQELHFSVLKDGDPILAEIEAEKNLLAGTAAPAHNFYYEAPTVVIISGDSAFGWSALDAGIAVENMALMAEGLGLGSVIIGCIKGALTGEKKDYFGKKLDFPEGFEYEIAIALGYKDTSKEPHTYDAARQVSYI